MTTIQKKALIDLTAIRQTLATLFAPGQVFEIRILEAATDISKPYPYTCTLTGYFDNSDDILRAITPIRKALGFYITLQECHPHLIARAYNKLVKPQKDSSTPDNLILRYRWLPIDLDPSRISKISSTDEQHELAFKHALTIKQELASRGWSDPLEADSGNGAHLLYRIDLENTPDNANLLKRTLEGLKTQFDIPEMDFDLTVYNPARIWKLYGTLACKGDDTPKWPHRMSRLLSIPEQIQTVNLTQLQKIAIPVQEPVTTVASNGHSKAATNMDTLTWLETWISDHQVDVDDRLSYQGGYKWMLAECPFCHESDHCAIITLTSNGIGFNCSHNRCEGKHWQDLRTFYEPDAYEKKRNKVLSLVPPSTSTKYQQTATAREEEPVKEEETKTPAPAEKQEKEDSQAQKLVSLALQQKESLFMTPKGEMYIRLRINGHIETLPISERGGAFKRWLVYRYLEVCHVIPNANAITQALTALEAQAQWGGTPQQETYIRVAPHDGNIYLDLANEQCEVVKITPQGWSITKTPPVCFRHPEGMLPLPNPVRGGSLDDLKPFINAHGKDWILIKAYLLGMLHPTGPYPILDLNGEKGTAKSSTARHIRSIVDPHQAPLRREPKDDQSFAIMAHNNYIVAFDNLSHISSRFSDLMCTLATRGGDAYRKHYSNDEECIFDASRPQIFTGIEDLATRGDLIDRCINIKLQLIEEYKDEATLNLDFKKAHPFILGALLDTVCRALRNLPTTQGQNLPRMADFALWVLAAEEAITGEKGTFLDIYRGNLAEGMDTEIEASPVGGAIVKLVANLDTFIEEKAADLLDRLSALVDDGTKRSRSWPKNARALSGQLKRLAPSLRAKNIHIDFKRRNDGGYICVTVIASQANGDAKSDANQKSDANLRHGDAKKILCVTPSTPDLMPDDTIVTQSDANFYHFLSSAQKEKREERGEDSSGSEYSETLRHFASPVKITPETSKNYPYDVIAWMTSQGIHGKGNCTRGHTNINPLPWFNHNTRAWEYACSQCFPALHRTQGKERFFPE